MIMVDYGVQFWLFMVVEKNHCQPYMDAVWLGYVRFLGP